MSLLSNKNQNSRVVNRDSNAIKKKQIYSYYQADQTGRVGQAGEKRRKYGQKQTILKKLRLVPTLLAITAILVSVVYSTTLSTEPIIKLVGDSKQYRDSKQYQATLAGSLQASIFSQNKLTLDTHSQEAVLFKNFPEIDAVTVSVPVIGRRPTAHIHTRTPSLIIVGETGSYVVDAYGVVIGRTSEVSTDLLNQLPTATDKSNLQIETGKQALTTDAINFIFGVKAELDNKQLKVAGLDLIAGGYEIDIHVKDQGYFLKTDSSGDARIQIGDYLAARGNGINPKEYMDVRVEEKVFYK